MKQKSFITFKLPPKTNRQEKVMPVIGRFVKWQADLIDFQRSFASNDGHRYILTIIDVFSKYSIAVSLKDKTGRSISDALFDIFNFYEDRPQYPRILQTDNGPEFTAKSVRIVCSLFKIHQIFSIPYSHLGFIERFNHTLKKKIYSRMAITGTSRYLDVLPDILHNYNHSIHKTLGDSPFTVQFCNPNQLRCQLLNESVYNSLVRKNNKNPIIENPLPVNTRVLILSYLDPFLSNLERNNIKTNFRKVSVPKWTSDSFIISNVEKDPSNENILRYILRDRYGTTLKRKFYHHEIQKIYVG
jgi:hypothetical protein